MRSDMGKVMIKRPRYGSSEESPKIRTTVRGVEQRRENKSSVMCTSALRVAVLFFSFWTIGGCAAVEEIHRAFTNLYQAADKLAKDPASEYFPDTKGGSDFPYPDDIQKQWRLSENAAANTISQADRRNLYPCAAELNGAIDKAERGYLIQVKQPNNPYAVQSGKDLVEEARKKVAACAKAAEYAKAGWPAVTPNKPQRAGTSEGSRGGGNPGDPPVTGDPGNLPGPGGSPGGPPGNGNPTGTPGNNGNSDGGRYPPVTPRSNGQTCPPEPDWVRSYKAQGAVPSMRYQTGFHQGVAQCLQDQCTIQNLAIAISVAAFPQARALLSLSQIPSVMDAVVHPPGFSPDPDPYTRGKDEGSRLCNWLLKLSSVANARRIPLIGKGGTITIPKGFNFYQAVNTMSQWLPKMNPQGCGKNCGIATVNSVRVLFGRPIEPAPKVNRGMTDSQMEAELGSKFIGTPATDVDMYKFLSKMPEGTVAVISAEPAAGNIPGHFFFGIKANGEFQFWDGQYGGTRTELNGVWIYRWSIVGNALNP